eukprot:6193988-Pleurochrysis_carterae.AAC.2
MHRYMSSPFRQPPKMKLTALDSFLPCVSVCLSSVSARGRETVQMVVDATAALCEGELKGLSSRADKEGCVRHDAHTLSTPAGFKQAYDAYSECARACEALRAALRERESALWCTRA